MKNFLIVLLTLLTLGLGGYIVYDKFVSKELNKTETKKEVKVEDCTKEDTKFKLTNKTELQALEYHPFYHVYVSKEGEVYLNIDAALNEANTNFDNTEKNKIKTLQTKYNTYKLPCSKNGSCETIDIKAIKLDVTDVISAYNAEIAQDLISGAILFIKADGTVSALTLEDLFVNQKLTIKNNINNLTNVVEIVQSSYVGSYSGSAEVIAIEKDGTQHVINGID